MLLPQEIGDDHHGEVGEERCPGAGHVTVPGNKQHVDKQGNSKTENRHVSTPLRLIGQLVPERQVEVDPEEELAKQDDGNHLQVPRGTVREVGT